ncbi:MAG: DNA polymerase I [Candidatus Delongbacteria bacterium]|jgi:DNA polymerase-1|nr:DNA polymerase I [Candidatus Delongbacteria bacterium]
MSKKLFLIDGYALIYRAFFAFGTKPLLTKEGFNISALYGFFNSLFSLIEKEKPEYMAIVLDTKAPTFRHKMYPEYKATREKMPEELSNQIPLLYEIIEATNITTISKDGFEADDLIGVMAKQASQEGFETYIYSSDKDLTQLVTENVFIYDPKEISILDREGIKKKFELYPEQIIDYLSLMGDNSDNIPGVPKVGKKTAIKLLLEFGTLENIYENLDNIKGNAVRESLKNNRHLADLSKKLVTLDTNIDIDFEIEDTHVKTHNYEKLSDYFFKLNMKKLLRYLEEYKGVETKLEKVLEYDPEVQKYKEIKSKEEIEELIKEVKSKKKLSVFAELSGNNPLDFRIKGLAISIKENEVSYIKRIESSEIDNQLSLFEEKVDCIEETLLLLKPLFENQNIKFIGYNLKPMIHALYNHGISFNGKIYDLLIADYIMYSSNFNHSLSARIYKLLNYKMIDPKSDAFSEDIKSCERAELLFRLYFRSKEKFGIEKELHTVFADIEIPLIRALVEAERNGIIVDRDYLQNMSNEIKEETKKITIDIYELSGQKFNIDSPKQLSEVLFEKLNFKHGRKGKSGTYSTDQSVLHKLATEGNVIAEHLLKYRELTKLNNTYAAGLLKHINKETGRIHTSYLQYIASTGRLSSVNPNLQNIPIKNAEGENIRKAFKAKNGYKLVAADYSQIELRILAHFCGDENLIEAFNNNIDIHTATASKLFNVPIEDVDKELRSKAKTANFAVLYGKSKFGLSEDMNISFDEAAEFIDNYFAQFSNIKEYIDNTVIYLEQYGYVKTLFGRKREIPEARSSNKNIQSAANRAAVNAPIQGTSADIIKFAMINIYNKIEKFDAKMLLQVHDELIFEVREEEIESFSLFVKDSMENIVKLKVPLTVNIGVGDNWLEAH